MHGEASAQGDPGRPEVPWRGLDLVVLFLLYYFWLALAAQVLLQVGFFGWYYGPQAVAVAVGDKAARSRAALRVVAGPVAGQAAESLAQQLALRFSLWAAILAFPFAVVSVPLVLAWLRQATPVQLGLTTRRLGPNHLAGLLTWAAVTPVVLALHQGLVLLFGLWPGGEPQEHPLIQLARQPLSAAEWGLLLFQALLLAPVMEELLFRGALLPWLAKHRWWGGPAAVGLAVVRAILHQQEALATAWPDPLATLAALLPVLGALAFLPVVLWLVFRDGSGESSALLGSAVLFGFVHGAWPSPMPLVVLGLALGWLARRSGSLVGPIVTHSLFNAVSAVQLLWLR
jgi:membrane protease YdiL (CAAX protease family)